MDEDECEHPNGFGVYGCPCGAVRDGFDGDKEVEKMATWSQEKVVTTRCRWVLPVKEPWGVCCTELAAVLSLAREAYFGYHPNLGKVPHNEIRVHAGDEEIVVSFTVEEHTK